MGLKYCGDGVTPAWEFQNTVGITPAWALFADFEDLQLALRELPVSNEPLAHQTV